jgi:hypothetical protein
MTQPAGTGLIGQQQAAIGQAGAGGQALARRQCHGLPTGALVNGAKHVPAQAKGQQVVIGRCEQAEKAAVVGFVEPIEMPKLRVDTHQAAEFAGQIQVAAKQLHGIKVM